MSVGTGEGRGLGAPDSSGFPLSTQGDSAVILGPPGYGAKGTGGVGLLCSGGSCARCPRGSEISSPQGRDFLAPDPDLALTQGEQGPQE